MTCTDLASFATSERSAEFLISVFSQTAKVSEVQGQAEKLNKFRLSLTFWKRTKYFTPIKVKGHEYFLYVNHLFLPQGCFTNTN